MNNEFVIDSENKIYKSALVREMSIWSNQPKCLGGSRCVCGNCSPPNNDHSLASEDNQLIRNYNNQCLGLESDNYWGWLDIVNKKIGKFDLGLSLGSGGGSVEHNLLKYDVVKNLETLDIVETPNSDKHLVGDLNFMKLPKERYDIIICKGSLHHIINLEHLLNQVNKSLKKDGFFVLLEYVGENKWQWSDDKIKFINNQFRKEFNTSNSIKIEKNKDILWNEVPFESIRSFQIPNLINYYFGQNKALEILWGGISFAVLNHLSTIDLNQIPKKQIKAWIQYSIVLDSQISANHDKISPCLLFGIYGKSLVKPKSVKKWEQAKISNNLSLKTPFFKKLKRYARKFIKGE